jgi:hypothetical protein
MPKNRLTRYAIATVLAGAVTVGAAQTASAAESTTVPAGEACSFELTITAEDLQQRNLTGAENGRPTRLVSAGSTGTVTVAGNGQSISFPSRGVGQTTVTEGDVTTVATGGQLLLALFPTDVPPGPSTTLYTGRVVFTINNLTGVFTLQKAAGRQVDVCSALGG